MRRILPLVFIIPLMVSCLSGNQSIPETATPSPTDTVVQATMTLPPTETPIPPTPTPDYINEICSPLQDVAIDELPTILTQPFKTPQTAKDDGHHGADFAFFRFKDYIGIEGLPILAAMEGEVVTILNNRPPYGHTVIIETPLDEIDPDLLAAMQLPEDGPIVEPAPNVNCPSSGDGLFMINEEGRSLYILYAHMQDIPPVQVGDHVSCGQVIGAVGNTGKGFSTNPHLHFETRVGPSGTRFESMAYYTVQSTKAERYNYCVWRVTNIFQLFDPMTTILSTQK
jgi:murein DD-endopeptidase MepM/ murein hydrolase activator NlpD